jgi:hypothetical protein
MQCEVVLEKPPTITVTTLCCSPKLKFPHVVSLTLKSQLLSVVEVDKFFASMSALTHGKDIESVALAT